MRRRAEAGIGCAEPIAGVVFGVHTALAEVGNLVMQIPVFGSTLAKNLIIAQGILFIDGWYLA